MSKIRVNQFDSAGQRPRSGSHSRRLWRALTTIFDRAQLGPGREAEWREFSPRAH